ncbi:hypothetical protein AMD24_00311 [Candidatus Xiphinematobacter sp. Idaho Grape]|uniref:glycoside hydrolase family 10 protein n=1 Tax=Candidatus Xiphinematobacter sp. Idaho Grape TaxID=1704307 RepID=UPI000706043F|nr:family 10 glycosylhydrolase [Candidatus Xiphinematobacter sp. Idaho Grape]ALJ56494.1 hypothetical protein AMD24_00311 [Candidatus Xiphinematobacter sp. Idaho Grape]
MTVDMHLFWNLCVTGMVYCVSSYGPFSCSSSLLWATEMRGAWIPSVYNLDFPSRKNMEPVEQLKEIRHLVAVAARCRLNNIFVQVRSESDALYSSSIEPWSRFLTGRQGRTPGFDPLQVFIREAKLRGIAVHAWINPYRVATNATNSFDRKHVSQSLAPHIRRVGNLLWMDPSSVAAQNHILRVVKDLISRYNLAGIHLDDYFYPYPNRLLGPFPDAQAYLSYRTLGGQLEIGDWRRQNINRLVHKLSILIHQERPGMKFGISPFGIYTRGSPSTVEADLDQLNCLYSDPVFWMCHGWVDYIAPQLYWKEGGPRSFSTLLKWWRSQKINPHGIPIYPGITLERLAQRNSWPVSEIVLQMRLEKATRPRGKGGFILWRLHQLVTDVKGISSIVARE